MRADDDDEDDDYHNDDDDDDDDDYHNANANNTPAIRPPMHTHHRLGNFAG